MIHQDRDNPHGWFTAGEAAALARSHGIAEVPTTESGMIKLIKRKANEDPHNFGAALAWLSRRRTGAHGGGGQEYHWHLFAGRDMGQMASILSEKSRERAQEDSNPAYWFSLEDLAYLAWRTQSSTLPHRKTKLAKFLADRARRLPDTFGADFKLFRKSPFNAASIRLHMSLFKFDRAFHANLVQIGNERAARLAEIEAEIALLRAETRRLIHSAFD